MATIVDVAQAAAAVQIGGADRHDVVAVDDTAGVVDGEQPVGVTVEGEAEVGVLDDAPWRRASRGALRRTGR